jgi:hypothetical protein
VWNLAATLGLTNVLTSAGGLVSLTAALAFTLVLTFTGVVNFFGGAASFAFTAVLAGTLSIARSTVAFTFTDVLAFTSVRACCSWSAAGVAFFLGIAATTNSCASNNAANSGQQHLIEIPALHFH